MLTVHLDCLGHPAEDRAFVVRDTPEWPQSISAALPDHEIERRGLTGHLKGQEAAAKIGMLRKG
jgi:hypothetical protein